MKRINQSGFVDDINAEPDAGDTHLLGHFTVKYAELKRIFGNPNGDSGYKTDAYWIVETPNGTGTIYNYKDGKRYLGREGTPKTKHTEWHIGGSDISTYAWIALAIFNN